MLFYIGKKHVYKNSVHECTKSKGHIILAQCSRKENGLKDKKNRFYVGHSHFEASQCPQVIGSAQDGGRAGGAKAISGQDTGSRQMRRRIENALESENDPKSIKKGFGDYEIL